MSLRRKLLAYLIVAHLLFLVASVLLYRTQPLIVLSLEVLVLASLAAGVHLASKVSLPLEYARRFGELLQDRNYAARLHSAPGDELADLVELFNNKLDALYRERLKLGEQRGFLDRLLEATSIAVVVFDFDRRITLLNASALALLGIDEAEGRPLSDWLQGKAALLAELDAAGRQRALSLIEQLDALPVGASRMLSDVEARRFRAQRSQFFDRGFPRDFLMIEELTAELASSERVTYEKLVRVLAHEVNNTVAATGSVLDSLLYYQPQLTASDGVDFSTAITAVKRRNTSLGEFIERFARVVKMPAADPRPTHVRDMIDDILRLFREQGRSRGIRIDWLRADETPNQSIDRNLLEPALLNIVKNALEAAEATLRETGASEGYVLVELVQEKGRIRLSVLDSGNRLGEVPAGQLFTPFFTTKKGGQGIGLLFAREVLNRHGFAHRLAATGDGETRFDIWMPEAQQCA